jgi:hypothetical protein
MDNCVILQDLKHGANSNIQVTKFAILKMEQTVLIMLKDGI